MKTKKPDFGVIIGIIAIVYFGGQFVRAQVSRYRAEQGEEVQLVNYQEPPLYAEPNDTTHRD